MSQGVPDLELFTVIKWIFIIMLSAGLAQFSSLWVKRKWYGSEPHDRREDTENTESWIERFLEVQKEHTAATVMLGNRIQKILDALEKNGALIYDFTKSAECKYEPKRSTDKGGSYEGKRL